MRRSAFLAFVCLTGCAQSQRSAEPDPSATRPTRVVLRDFAADPAQVVLDPSVADRTDADGEREEDLAAARRVVTSTLTYRLQAMNLTVVHATGGAPAETGDLLLEGRLERVDEGDGSRRASGGDHRGVVGAATVLRVGAPDASAEIARVSASSETARPPGGPGAAAAASVALRSGGARGRELRLAGVTAEGRRLGNLLADQLRTVFARRGWVSPG